MPGRISLDGLLVFGPGGAHPSRQGEDQRDHAGREDPAAEDEAEEQQRGAERGEEREERWTRHVDAGRRPGVLDVRQGRDR
jgi:hypothetical protein